MGRIGIWLRNLAIIGVLVVFAFFFGQPEGSDPMSAPVAEVNSEKVPRDVFELFREQNEEAFRQFDTAGVDSDQLSAMIDEQTRNSLLRRYVLSQEAEALGLGVSEASLVADFQSNPSVRSEGKFDRELAERVIARTGLGSREYAAQHRRDLLLRNFSRTIASPVLISDAAVRDEILRNETQLTLRYATASRVAFRERAAVTSEQAQALVASDPDRVRAVYQLRLADFSRPEQVRARHILFSGEDAEARAIATRARLDAGESFADLAAELSADAATRGDGGDLGTFPRGRMMAPFDEAAFALEPGVPSGPVKTDRGVHLILVESRQEASQTPFEEVAELLAIELLKDERASSEARDAAVALTVALAEGKPFVASADALLLPVSVTAPFGIRDPGVPGLPGVSDLKEEAFALTPAEPNARRLFSDAENFYAVALLSRQEPDQARIDAETAATRERLLQRERALTTGLWFNERLKELEAQGKVSQFELSAGR